MGRGIVKKSLFERGQADLTLSGLPGVLDASSGGTGQSSYTVGDILYASGATTLSKLADVATGNALISGGVGVAPSWGKIGLTTHVSGTLGVGNGGTGSATTFTEGSVVFAGASGIYSQDNSGLFFNATDNYLGIGTASPIAPLHAVKAFIDPSFSAGIAYQGTFANTLDNDGQYLGTVISVTKTDDFNEAGGRLKGVTGTATISGLGNLSEHYGFEFSATNSGGATQAKSIGAVVGVSNTGLGTITDAYAFEASTYNTGGGTVTNAYGFKVGALAGTNKFGFYNDISGSINRFLTLNLGTPSSVTGQLVLHNSTNANTVTIQSGATGPISSYSLTLPTAQASGTQVLSNNGSGVLSWSTPSTGFTVGGTVTSGTDTRVFFQDGSVIGQDADFTWNNTTNVLNIAASALITTGINFGANIFLRRWGTIGSNSSVLLGNTNASVDNLSGCFIGDRNTLSYSEAGSVTICGTANTSITSNSTITGASNSLGGGNSNMVVNGISNSISAADGGYGIGIGTGNTLKGLSTVIGHNSVATGANQLIFGTSTTYYYSNVYFNSVTSTSVQPVILNACGGSGANIAGANFTIAAGRSTGNNVDANTGDIYFQTSDAGASSSTPQTLTTKFTVKKSGSIEVTKAIDTTAGDSATIDKVAGRFRKDTSGATFTLTNALITANSIILLTPIQVDATALTWGVVAGAGSCVVTFNAVPTSNFDMNFLVIN